MDRLIDENFVKTYSDKQYQHTAMVNHRGTIVSFAMDTDRKIYYAVLDTGKEDRKKGPLDVKYWVDNPQLLPFPGEIEQVGYSALSPVQMPKVKMGTRLEASTTTTVYQSEADAFLSTTARLTRDAPFQVLSDNQHIYVFRQSLARDHADMVYKLKSGGSSGVEENLTRYVTDSDNNKVPLVTETLLADRFILAGTTLKLPREVRFRRSGNRTRPVSAKDSLGSKDMQGNAFYETTKELDFVQSLDKGSFSVILLPTQIADIERWQIFAYNNATKLIDTFNIERSEDGFFNTQGTQLYTSPDPRYKASVLERKPGACPFTGLPLVPNVSKSGYAEWALQFDNTDAHINLGNPVALQITGDQTIEMWIKPAVLGKRQNPFDKAHGGECAITLEPDGTIAYYYGQSGQGAHPYEAHVANAQISAGAWTHIAIVRDLTNRKLHWYINGVPSGSKEATYAAATKGAGSVFIGKGYAGNFEGLIDEVRIWNRACSDAEIKSAMNHRLIGDEFGLAGYWRFDEATGAQVNDMTRNANHGTLSNDTVKWVTSDAPIGEHPGMQRTSFAFDDREVDAGLVTRLYYQQEKHSNAEEAKPVRQNARVLLAAVTGELNPNTSVNQGQEITTKKYVAAVDFGVSRAGKLARTPNVIPLPSLLSTDPGDTVHENILDEIASIEIDIPRLKTEIAILNSEIATLNSTIQFNEMELTDVPRWNWWKFGRDRRERERFDERLSTFKNLRDRLLPLRKNQKTQKNTLLQDKQREFTQKSARLTELRKTRIGTPQPQPMIPFHTDPRGLTISSGLLGFAYTDSQPCLFESALGRMVLYFKGVNNQFFSAYYDVNTARAKWSLAVGSGTLTLVSHAPDSQVNDTTIIVTDGADADHCTVTIENTHNGLIETWGNVPREVMAFSQVLNGEVTEKVFVGKLQNDLSGTTTTTINLKDGLPHEVLPGSILIVGDSISEPDQLKMAVSTKAVSGAKQIMINSTTLTHNADTKVYLLRYDYAANATSNRPGYALDKGNLQVNVMVGSATGNVGNATASRYIDAQSSQWVADDPGSACYFDGENDYLDGASQRNFEHAGDITLEAWVRPTDIADDSCLIHCQSDASTYSLGLREKTLNSALSFDGSGDYVTLPTARKLGMTNHDFTVESWIKVDAGATGVDQPILGNNMRTSNKGLHLTIRNDRPYMGFYNNDLTDDSTILTKGTWYHLAFRYTTATKEQAIFVNGDLTSRRIAPTHYSGADILTIGNMYGDKLHGKLDEVRIWSIARAAEDIKTNMSRRLNGQEPSLTAYYHFENADANDRSGNGHHGILQGNLTSRDPVASPLKAYTCFATVGDDAITTTKPVVSYSWHHFAAVYNQSYALRFDDNAYCDAGNESMLNITEDLTIEAFIKLDTLGRNHGIVSKGIMDNGGEGSVPYAFYIDKNGKLVLEFEDEDGRNYRYSSSSRVSAGTFKRVAVVRKTGQEKIEKIGTQAIKYTDGDGEENTRNIQTIESIEFKENSDVRFYIDSADAGSHTHKDKKPIGNNGSLYLGQSYIANQQRARFQGTISEIRIWNVARPTGDVNTHLMGTEGGLTAWWRFEENTGNITDNVRGGGSHARITEAQWVKNPDPKGSRFIIYSNGKKAATEKITRPDVGDAQFTVGARKQNGYREHYKGNLEEVRIWKTARREEEILDNLFTRLKGEKKDLIANYSFDDITSTEVKDSGLNGNHLTLPSAADQQPVQVLSSAPISNDTAQVRSALAGIRTDFHAQISGRPAVAEYADMQRLEDATLIGVHKRCYAYIQNGKWRLSTGYKVGNLITEWIGQAQFDPQVTGYIEGAPPVPSENLTEGYMRTTQTFNGTTEVTVNESENVNYSISTSKESGFSSGFEMEANLGLKFDPRILLAPLGFGISKKIKFSFQSTLKLEMEANGAWSGGESFGSGQNVSRQMSAAIGGNWDVADKTKWVNPDLTRRFIPANMGFAFVESETADIYALRLAHNGALVAFRMLPNPDIPKDTNIIPFPINNHYSKQGTLDGRIGYTSTGVALDPDYATATGYGEHSYFKPKEAYELKKRIERETQRLKDYYNNFDTTPAGTQLMGSLAAGIGGGVGGAGILATTAAGPVVLSGALIAGGMGATIGSLIDATTTKDEDLPKKYARRNIANTYVWTADGGFYEESTQISEVRSESKSGSYSFNGKATGGFELEIEAAAKSDFGLKGMLGGSLNLTKSKSEEASNSFSISMKLLVPDNLQQYVYKRQIDDPDNEGEQIDDTDSGVEPVYDNKGNPVSQPGKVDAYRFMTFHLEPGLNNFEDLFGKVIDPIWLEESQHPNAMALRQANQSSKKPKCWRVFHRVTFVSRILPDFPSATAPSLEKKMKDLNIASNYELVRRLEPFVRDYTANFIQFQDAVKAAVQAYLPELSGDNDLNQITWFLADYYGVAY